MVSYCAMKLLLACVQPILFTSPKKLLLRLKNIKMTTNKVNKQKLDKLIPPLTSWMKLIKKNVEDLNLEDRKKYDRLEILSSLTGIECNIPIYKLKTTDVLSNKINIKFKGRCGWRLIPSKNNFPKLRTRGKSMSVNKKWLIEEKINPKIYPLILYMILRNGHFQKKTHL